MQSSRTAQASSLDLRFYRSGIADVQALCERTLGRRFQALAIWQQLAVLAQIERPAGAARGVGRHLLDLLLNDAAEAYFEVAASSWADVPEARCAVTA